MFDKRSLFLNEVWKLFFFMLLFFDSCVFLFGLTVFLIVFLIFEIVWSVVFLNWLIFKEELNILEMKVVFLNIFVGVLMSLSFLMILIEWLNSSIVVVVVILKFVCDDVKFWNVIILVFCGFKGL